MKRVITKLFKTDLLIKVAGWLIAYPEEISVKIFRRIESSYSVLKSTIKVSEKLCLFYYQTLSFAIFDNTSLCSKMSSECKIPIMSPVDMPIPLFKPSYKPLSFSEVKCLYLLCRFLIYL